MSGLPATSLGPSFNARGVGQLDRAEGLTGRSSPGAALSLVARAKITNPCGLSTSADPGAAIIELSRRGIRAKVRKAGVAYRPAARKGQKGGRARFAPAVGLVDEHFVGESIRPRWYGKLHAIGGKRGIIRTFSESSRRRFVYRLSNWRGADRLITLTTHANERSARRSGRSLSRFLNWARSRGLQSYVWIRERQRRGAIHYHLWTDGFGPDVASKRELTKAWTAATGERWSRAAAARSVDPIPWNGPAWYAVQEASKRYQKQPAPVSKWGSAGRFWACSRDVSRASVVVPLGIDGVRWFRRWLRKIAPEYGRTIREKVHRSAMAASLKLGMTEVQAEEWAREYAAGVVRRAVEWLRRYGGGFLMLDRLRNVEQRLPELLGKILDADSGRGLVLRFPA